MTEAFSITRATDIICAEGNSLTIKLGDYRLTLKIEGPEVKSIGRLQLERGKTLFDLILDAARIFVKETGESEFTASELYHIAVRENPQLEIKRSSWNSHVVSSAQNHPSYRHYTARRQYFRYMGKGRYSLEHSIDIHTTL